MFFGTYENKVDKKGRVSIPANFRPALLHPQFSGVLAFSSFRFPCIEACNYNFMEKIKSNMGVYNLFSDEHDNIATTIFGETIPLNIDTDGRIVLPKHFVEHANIIDKASFVGIGDIFQIWNPCDLSEHKKQCRIKIKEKGLTLPQSPSQTKEEVS